MQEFGFFKEYDIRGIVGQDVTEDNFYKVARAAALVLCAKRVVVGYDARASSPALAMAVAAGAADTYSHEEAGDGSPDISRKRSRWRRKSMARSA